MDILIGTQFHQRGKNRTDLYTVIDILKTYNIKNELIKTMYLCEHNFLGQKVFAEVPEATIVRSLINTK